MDGWMDELLVEGTVPQGQWWMFERVVGGRLVAGGWLVEATWLLARWLALHVESSEKWIFGCESKRTVSTAKQ
jgi:hypothetical protein